jgi:hypothetical protein
MLPIYSVEIDNKFYRKEDFVKLEVINLEVFMSESSVEATTTCCTTFFGTTTAIMNDSGMSVSQELEVLLTQVSA